MNVGEERVSRGFVVEEDLVILSFNVADGFWADRLVSLTFLFGALNV